jgi:AAA+ superfamily predicted ATPase
MKLYIPILNALKDITKYSIIKFINTGDKTLDNLINTLLLALMSIMFTSFFWHKIQFYFYSFNMKLFGYSKFRNYSSITKGNVKVFQYLLENYDNLKYVSWIKSKGDVDVMSYRIFSYILCELYFLSNSVMVPIYDFENDKLSDKHAFEGYIQHTDRFTERLYYIINEISKQFDTSEIKDEKEYAYKRKEEIEENEEEEEEEEKERKRSSIKIPLYAISNDDIIGIITRPHQTLVLVYTSDKILRMFNEKIKKYNCDNINNKGTKKLRISQGSFDRELYNDRTFDTIVSRHKPMIINMFDDFLKSQEKSRYNGFGNYNIGIILHGKPGTGKTSFVKAICNYVQRDAYIVDMSKIRTKKDFEYLFYSRGNAEIYKNKVYILEEFDTVQGIIKSRDLITNTIVDHNSEKEKLKQQRHDLLVSTVSLKNMPGQIKLELEELNTQIKEYENMLTLDTMLTVLDGVFEMRGRIIIATTNYIDSIDDALLRPGRFDLKLHLNAFNSDEVKELLHKMFDGIEPKSELEKIDKAHFSDGIFTPTDIINICHKYQTLKKVIKFLTEPQTP